MSPGGYYTCRYCERCDVTHCNRRCPLEVAEEAAAVDEGVTDPE